jgi:diacylglycerol O-acyltransferase
MKQLGILDSAFINLEQTNTPQHVGGLGIYDPSTAPGGVVRFKQVIDNFERRLKQNPLFRTRLVEVPGGLDRPYWVKDGHFDVEFHLRHIALPQPGDWRQLCIQVARLHSRPIDMSRPLWEAYIIEGLDNIPNLPAGCFAVYTKMHHALVDGAGGASFMALLHDLVAQPTEEDEQARQSDEPLLVDSEPSVAELLTKASVNSLKNGLGLMQGTVKNSIGLGKYALGIARKEIPAPDVSAPKTILNQAVGPHRVFDAAEFPLDGFKTIKNAAQVTLNDVALAVIGGALQRYLVARGEAPQGSLAASMPVNMRTRRGTNEDNNQVGAVFASLHSNIEDPLERLSAVHDATQEAKTHGEASPMVDILKLAGAFSPLVSKTLAGFWSRNQLSKLLPVNVSTVVSNVPGPDFPLYCAGAKMVDYYGLGVLTPGMGVFHLVFSYSGKVTLSVLADRDILPDPEFYKDCLVSSYQEMYQAVVPQKKPRKAPVKKDKAANAKSSTASDTKPAPKPKLKLKAKTKPKAKAKSAAKKALKPAPKPKSANPRPKAQRRKPGKPDLKVVPKLRSVK